MFDRYNRFIATDDPDEFRYYAQLKAMNISVTGEVYLNDNDRLAGYKIRFMLKVNGVGHYVEKLLPLGSLEYLPDDTLEEYIDNMYSGAIVELFELTIK